ncbi:MAG: polysaccharide pyruvyl transferase family protein [Solibacillus sp.]
MKKIGIVTLNGYFNYGNRLQNYALQETLKGMGYTVETLKYENRSTISIYSDIKARIKSFKKNGLKNQIRKIKSKKEIKELKKIRIEEFKVFSLKHIMESNFIIKNNKVDEVLIDDFEYFVAGSDQIWNPFYHYSKLGQEIEYLKFSPKQKRLSYAASFGIDHIPTEYKAKVKQGLEGMESILVREQAGADIVKKIIAEEVSVVLDPTMLLNKSQWLQISERFVNKPKEKYILTYFLGEKSALVHEYLNDMVKKYNYEIVDLEDMNAKHYYHANPGHFVDFIDSASLVVTDSFHGVVFSILMETPFVVFKREDKGPSMYSRIETLLNTFNLTNRQYTEINNSDVFSLDFASTQEILKLKKEESLMKFKESLK